MKLKLGRYFILLGTWPHTCFGPVGPHLQGGGGLGVVLEVLAALVVHFWDNFIKQKLKSTPDLVWWVRSDQVLDLTQGSVSQSMRKGRVCSRGH